MFVDYLSCPYRLRCRVAASSGLVDFILYVDYHPSALTACVSYLLVITRFRRLRFHLVRRLSSVSLQRCPAPICTLITSIYVYQSFLDAVTVAVVYSDI